ncbi:MAG TPA: response regulator [Gemmataceae bacterium]|nr:response regulator [Gemmataceae bacterium]
MTDSQSVGETVLVVENNCTARALLADLLKRRGYKLVTAEDGAAALALLVGRVNPDLILLDMLLPRVDGWAFLEAIRHSRHREVPVIVTSGIGLTDEWATDHGCVSFLHKPYDGVELFAAIGRVLKSPDARRGSRVISP